jgi:hypothetical protein
MIGMNGISDIRPASKQQQTGGTILIYVLFLAVAFFVYHLIAEGEFSSVLTISAIFQCLAFSLLGVQALTGSVSGISAKSLQLDALALACRLSATSWLEGYIPNDATGDYLYQCFDGLSLCVVLWLLYRVLKSQKESYEAEEDGLSVAPFAAGSFILAALLHADLNDSPLFDTLWMCGLLVNTVAVVPQLWMMTRRKESLPALISHFVAIMGVSRVLTGTYMWHGYEEITCEPWFGDFNHAAPAVLGTHVVHLMLLADFFYFYVKNLATAGLDAPLELSGLAWSV